MSQKKMWGARFTQKTDPEVEAFSSSFAYDRRLAKYDLWASLWQAEALRRAGVLKRSEAVSLKKAINQLLAALKKGRLKIEGPSEDIHSYLQGLLEKRLGRLAFKLHTARSRNEQVALDVRLYLMEESAKTIGRLEAFRGSLASLSQRFKDVIIPGYTHLQHAQALSWSVYVKAYLKMVDRDRRRLLNLLSGLELCLGAGALAGSPFKGGCYTFSLRWLNQEFSRLAGCNLGLAGKLVASDCPADWVSDRDFVLEALACVAILGMHLSRLAEEFILYFSSEFGFLDIGDAFCTGSSLMPQKKNPDVLELVRGYTGRLYGNLVSLLVVMKGLPLTYNRDLQLDKEPLFDSFSLIQRELSILTKLMGSITLKKEFIKRQLEDESLYATDLVYYLVEKGIVFKEAHGIVGRLMRYCLTKKKSIRRDVSQEEVARFCPQLVLSEIRPLFDPRVSVSRKRSIKK